MTKLNTNSLNSFEEKLSLAMHVKDAPEDFTQTLKSQLENIPESKDVQQNLRLKSPQMRWAVAGISLALIAVIIVLAIGPKTVWAEIASFLQRLPGVGNVEDLGESCVLAEPISITQEGYTITLEALSSTDKKGWVRFSLDGWQGDRDFYYMMIREFGKLQYNIDTIKPQSTFVGDIYQSELLYLEYELPPVCHAKDFRLAFLSLPASKQNMAPEVWEFEPKLRAARKEDTLPKNDQGFLSSEEHEGITMQILAYYETPKFTGLSYRFQTPSLRNSVSLLGGWNPSNPMIIDSEGNNYYEQDRRSASSHFGYFSMVNKMPHDESFHLNSPSMMLYWNELDFEILEKKAPITIDFSGDFEKGHVWNLDFWYEYDYPHKIYFDKVVYRESPPHLEVHYGTDNDIKYIQLYCFSDVATLCKGSPYSSTEGVFRIGLTEKPSGQLKLGLYSVSREIEPPEGWTIDFTLDELPKAEWLPLYDVPYIVPEQHP